MVVEVEAGGEGAVGAAAAAHGHGVHGGGDVGGPGG